MDKLRVWDRFHLGGEYQVCLAREYGVSRQRIGYIVSKRRDYWEKREGLKGRPPKGTV